MAATRKARSGARKKKTAAGKKAAMKAARKRSGPKKAAKRKTAPAGSTESSEFDSVREMARSFAMRRVR